MKLTLLSLLSFLFILTIHGQNLVWSDPVEVATGHGNLRPRLALTNLDVPLIVWGGGTASQPVYVARWDGNAFTSPVAVSPEGIDPYCASWTGPDIASVGNDVLVVFDAEVDGDFRVYTVRSVDGGLTFADTVNVGGYSGLTRFAAIGTADFANPTVAFMDHDPGYADPRYMVSTSNDAGNSWQTPVDGSNSLTGDEVCDCCPPEIVTDGLNIMLMFRNNDSNLRDMWATVSADDGQTFTNGSDVDDGNWTVNSCPSTGADGFMRGDSVIMTWTTGGFGFPNKVMLNAVSKTTAMGRANQVINPFNTTSQNYPRIHGDENVFGVVYQESVGGNLDCFLAYSTDGTTNFEQTNIIINEPAEGSQINPDVMYSNGIFHFSWQDNQTGNVMYRSALLQDVGIDESVFQELQIYPNPTRGFINIKGSNDKEIEEIEILNSTGKILHTSSQPIENDASRFDISDFPPGLYFVRAKSDGIISMSKFLKID